MKPVLACNAILHSTGRLPALCNLLRDRHSTDEGRRLQVTLYNGLPADYPMTTAGISIHWHGLSLHSPDHTAAWYDGTPYVAQCPVKPGHSFVYRFTITDNPGTRRGVSETPLWVIEHPVCRDGCAELAAERASACHQLMLHLSPELSRQAHPMLGSRGI